MKAINFKLKMLGFVFVFALGSVSYAGFWDWSKPYRGPEKDVLTLFVTGNYTKSRLLAELAQVQTKQPILLVPQTPGGNFYFLTANGEGYQYTDDKFTKFIKYLNPRQIIIIGDQKVVPDSYLKRIDQTQTFIRIHNKDWVEISKAVAKIIDEPTIPKDYKRLLEELESGRLYGSRAGVEAPQPVVEIEPVVEDVVIEETPPIPEMPSAAPEPVIIENITVPK